MANGNDWADPDELGGLSRAGNVLQSMGYDPDEVRSSPALRAEVKALREQVSRDEALRERVIRLLEGGPAANGAEAPREAVSPASARTVRFAAPPA